MSLVLKSLSALALYRRVALLRVSLDSSDTEPVGDWTIARLGAGELPEMVRLRAGVSADTMRQRFERGDLCFGGRAQDGELVSIAWGALETAHLPYLARTFTLGQDLAYVYDVFTSRNHRGSGASPAVTAVLLRHLHGSGCVTALAATVPENRSSYRFLSKLGYREYGRLGYLGVGPLKWHFGSFLP